MYKHDSFEQLLKWRTTKTNGCHPAVSLWRWGEKMKKKNPMQFREVYLKLLENILPQALCPAAADTKKI